MLSQSLDISDSGLWLGVDRPFYVIEVLAGSCFPLGFAHLILVREVRKALIDTQLFARGQYHRRNVVVRTFSKFFYNLGQLTVSPGGVDDPAPWRSSSSCATKSSGGRFATTCRATGSCRGTRFFVMQQKLCSPLKQTRNAFTTKKSFDVGIRTCSARVIHCETSSVAFEPC
jgi:hypothetical protein